MPILRSRVPPPRSPARPPQGYQRPPVSRTDFGQAGAASVRVPVHGLRVDDDPHAGVNEFLSSVKFEGSASYALFGELVIETPNAPVN